MVSKSPQKQAMFPKTLLVLFYNKDDIFADNKISRYFERHSDHLDTIKRLYHLIKPLIEKPICISKEELDDLNF